MSIQDPETNGEGVETLNLENIESKEETNPNPNSSRDPAAPAPTSQKNLCGVCHDAIPKYKCSQCLLPYCSVACSKLHKDAHPADSSKEAIHAPKPVSTPISKPAVKVLAGTVAAAGSRGPFAALEDSKELRALFKLYPKLSSQLDEINNATLRPCANTFEKPKYGKGRAGNGIESWNQDRGIENGVKALNNARNSSTGEAVREYSNLILQILSEDEGLHSAQLIQQELAEENARIIEALLNGER